jgi:hypothetical protein
VADLLKRRCETDADLEEQIGQLKSVEADLQFGEVFELDRGIGPDNKTRYKALSSNGHFSEFIQDDSQFNQEIRKDNNASSTHQF